MSAGSSENFNDHPTPGMNIHLDYCWLESIAREHVGYGGRDRFNDVDRAAMLVSLVLIDCARTNAIAQRNAAKTISDAAHELAEVLRGNRDAKAPGQQTTHDNTNHP